MRSLGREGGFALMELVVVIAVLAVLAAFAVPRFLSLEVQTRTAAVQALAGSLRSSAALSHSLWLSQGQPASVTMEGRSIAMVNGYPDRATVGDSVADASGFNYTATTGVFIKIGVRAGCTVTYDEAQAGEVPNVTVDVGGC
jgi:MSHA pilin protein MshA